MPERIMEFVSYQAMIACVAAGTGFAVVPKSVLQGLRATRSVRQHVLPKRFVHNRTYVVWHGDPSPSLRGSLPLLVTTAPDCSVDSKRESSRLEVRPATSQHRRRDNAQHGPPSSRPRDRA